MLGIGLALLTFVSNLRADTAGYAALLKERDAVLSKIVAEVENQYSSGVGTDEAVACCNATCNQTSGRCNFPSTTCHAVGAGCAVDADCCKGRCLLNALNLRVCEVQCVADAAACTSNAECCSFHCTGSPARCAPPLPGEGGAVCLPTGRSCASSGQCCSGSCVTGFCDLPCQLRGVACRVGSDCCSGTCTGNLCQP